jgi:large subunit ribosomal protein L9
MEVILLERVASLGQMGDVVRVKDGFVCNFLLPRGKALRATTENRTRFEGMKSELQARSQALKSDASQIAGTLDGKSFTVLRQASESGQLFGSVSPRDLVGLLAAGGFAVSRSQIALNTPIKMIGRHSVPILLHPEIETTITIVVGRNADEAARIERGEDITRLREERSPEEEARLAAEAFFEPGAGEAAHAGEDESGEAAAAPAAEADKS